MIHRCLADSLGSEISMARVLAVPAVAVPAVAVPAVAITASPLTRPGARTRSVLSSMSGKRRFWSAFAPR